MLTDRPIYKPGDTVKFSGFIRLASYTEMTEMYPSFVTVKVREPRGKIFYKSKMPVSPETGAFSGRFTVPEEAALGHYGIEAELFGSVAFRVEEYKKPEYEVKLDIPSKPVRIGETVTAIELAPEGTGYRARTRFAKFFNLPELFPPSPGFTATATNCRRPVISGNACHGIPTARL